MTEACHLDPIRGIESGACDLHLHSTASDGLLSPTEVVREAAEAGVEVVALTDHDTVAGFDEAHAAGVEHGVVVLPGAELTCRHATLGRVDLIALGSPHFSLTETRRFADLLKGQRIHPSLRAKITLGRDVFAKAGPEIDRLRTAGVEIHQDLCWCSITEPLFPVSAKTVMTNSGKYAHYAPGLSGRMVRFASLAECANAALTGTAPRKAPPWLGP